MTDSENEDIFSYPNVTTTVSARGPNINVSNVNVHQKSMSTMYNMPRNFERQRYNQSGFDQRSIYRRETSPMSTRSAYFRETSPMSTRSAYDTRPFNFRPCYTGISSHQSMYHGRSGSPVSLRSIDSSASVSAKDIAFAFKTAKFNSHDIQIIKHAYRNLIKFRTRERFERKRKLRVFIKGNQKSGDDSGEQASDSSISSEDCRSAKTTNSKVSNTKFDFSDLRNPVKDNNNRDGTDVRQNKFKNMFIFGSANASNRLQNNSSSVKQNNLLKDRFKSSFLLPSQRFNQSVASTIISENGERRQHKNKNEHYNTMQAKNHLYQKPNNINSNTDSEHDEIFSETVKENNIVRSESQNKRSLGEDELNLPYNKRSKICSQIKNTTQNFPPVANNNKNNIINNFEFVKPALPTKKVKSKLQDKLIPKSSHAQEVLIAKSSQPLEEIIDPIPCKPHYTVESSKQPSVKEKANTAQTQPEQHETMDNTDVSMRPSFIKRKLFTQKLDVVEKSNVSSDGFNSPLRRASDMPKEKNKTRKLVTTQSCLNREVQDDNNLLDLIHKIVPPDQMNATSQSSVNLIRSNGTKSVENESKKNDDDKWDVTTVISMCNDDDCSDTYTDEEIFKMDNKVVDDSKSTMKTVIQPCRVDIIQLPVNKRQQIEYDLSNRFKSNDVTTSKLQNCAKSFWDTDTESDLEWPLYRSNVKENKQPENVPIQQLAKNPAENRPPQKTNIFPNITKSLHSTAVNTTKNSDTTVDNAQKFKVGNYSFRSHRTSKKKKCCNETCVTEPQKQVDVSKPVKNAQKQTTPKSNSKSLTQRKNKTSQDVNHKIKSTEVLQLTTKARQPKPDKKSNPNFDTHSGGKSKSVRNKKGNNNDVEINISSVLDSTVDSVENNSSMRQRPLRSCRTTSQNRSIEASKSLQLGNDSCFSKSLRSRTIINLSSSIENISLNIKPRSKAVKKTIAQIKSRKSDVSFSLGNEDTTASIKVTRNKGKR